LKRQTGSLAAYDEVAPFYEDFHWLFLATAAAGVERQLQKDLRQVLRPGTKVLDAACGTGRISRLMRRIEPRIEVTLVDQSSEMLALAASVPGEHIRASLLDLPFEDGSFDLVVSGYAIETIARPERALSELARVLRPGGALLFTYCSMPSGPIRRATSIVQRLIIERSFAGRFLPHDLAVPEGCTLAHRHRGRRQLAVEVAALCEPAS
jgi:ubiquinone/menaquinone biosynthesis C-methylase UbiE